MSNFVSNDNATSLFTKVGQKNADLLASIGLPAGAGKNLLKNTLTTTTMNGVTFTANNDGSISVSTEAGGATADAYVDFPYFDIGNYIVSGCPNGGGNTTYGIQMRMFNGSTWYKAGYDFGDGYTFSSQDIANATRFVTRILVYSGCVITTPITFYPMIRPAGTSPDYVPYSESVQGEIDGLDDSKQNKTLSSAVSIAGASRTTVEAALSQFSNFLTIGNANQIAENAAISTLDNLRLYYLPSTNTVFNGDFAMVFIIKFAADAGYMIAFRISTSTDVSSNAIAYRKAYGDEWSNWAKLTGTNISPT